MTQEDHIQLVLGRDHPRYGRVDTGQIEPALAWAISVGSNPTSPSHIFKRDPEVPNEDALFGAAVEDAIVLAVADAHFGPRASHALLERLADRIRDRVPPNVEALQTLIAGLGDVDAPEALDDESETTLVVAIVSRRTGRGFGISYGDSSVVHLSPSGPRRLHRATPTFVSPARPVELTRTDPQAFEIALAPGDVLVAFTDGVDGCHYGRPETSVTLDHVDDLYRQSGRHPPIFTRRLAIRALNGIDPNPGGQDNIAVIAWRAPQP